MGRPWQEGASNAARRHVLIPGTKVTLAPIGSATIARHGMAPHPLRSRILVVEQLLFRLLVPARRWVGVRAVDEVDDARGERLGREQAERYLCGVVSEEAQPGTGNDGMDEEMQLVEQPRLQQLAHYRDRSAQRDAPDRGVGLQPSHALDEVALELLGVAPGELEGVA